MHPNDSVPDVLNKMEAPHLPQQSINSMLNEAMKKASAAANLGGLSADIGKHIASIASAADWSRQLLRSFEAPKSALQRVIDEAAASAAMYRKLGSLTDILATASSVRTFVDFHQELLRSVQLPKSSIQFMVDAAQKAISNLEFHSRSTVDVFASFSKMYSPPAFERVLTSVQQVMTTTQLWQSARITELASRILREGEFRNALIAQLESQSFVETPPEVTHVSIPDVLSAVENALEESEALETTIEAEAAVRSLFSWWGKLHPDLRTLVIGVLVAILSLVVEYGVFVKDKPTSDLPTPQRVKIVQRITNKIFLNVGVPSHERRLFRVVAKDQLPVFRSNRRDSGLVSTLAAGQVVIVKSKNRNWTRIQWKDSENQEMLTGWVFARYLKKI